ncbi:MAG: hypothetical protein HOB26_10720 [Flavobacteriales bacterium]|jgi:hypothetical protein|nr:hypothetical protein [Flavobacteriales bacterium]MBT6747017.1 hypothetical protein [Flavobacteriales bacterium]
MLSENWITDKTTDFEYKKYTVLAYLQSVYKSFGLKELYPVLPSLDNHHNQLELFIHNKQAINEIAHKRIIGIDWKKLKLNYDHEIKMSLPHIDRIVDFTLPLFKNAIENGETLKEEIQSAISIEPLGIVPLYQNEGFLLFHPPAKKTTWVYRYSCNTLTHSGSYIYKYVTDYALSIKNTFYEIKSTLATFSELKTPATYLISSENHYPAKEAFIPLACKLFEDYHAEIK